MAKTVRASVPSRTKKEKSVAAPAVKKAARKKPSAPVVTKKFATPEKIVSVKATALKKVAKKGDTKSAVVPATSVSPKKNDRKVVVPVKITAPKAPEKKTANKPAIQKTGVKSVKKATVTKKAATPAVATKPAKKTAVTKQASVPEVSAKKAVTKKVAAPEIGAKKTASVKKTAAPKKAAKPAKKAAVKAKSAARKPIAKAKASSPKSAPKAKAEKAAPKPVLPSFPPPQLPDGTIRVLVTQPRPEGERSPYYDLAKKYDLNFEFHPFIRVEGLTGKEFRRQKVDLKEYTAIVFTSRLAVDHFFRIVDEMKTKVNQDLKYFCITEAVALYLQKFILYRKRKVFFSADGSTQGLLDVIGKHKNEKYVVPMSDSTKKEIPAFLAKMKIPHAEASLYRTVSNDLTAIAKNVYDMIVFFSPYSVQALFDYEPTYKQNGTVIGAFGPTTTKAVEDAGLRLDIKAPAINAPSMTSALELFLAEQTVSKTEKKEAGE